MDNINELIKKLCPDGVEYHELKNSNLFKFYYGKGNKIPEDIGGKYDVYGANGVVSHINEYNCEDVSIIGHIGAVGMVNRCKGKCFVTYNGTIAEVVDKSKVDSQYLYYVLTTLNLPSYKKGSQPFLSVSDFEKIRIPLPPLDIQIEIARILDGFTLLLTELSSELRAREKQYDFYKEKLLTISKTDETIEWVTLGSYCKRLKGTAITAGKMKEIENVNGNVKIFAGGKTVIDTDESNIPAEDIIRVPNIIVQSRGVIDFIYYDKPCSFKREMWSYTLDNEITLKYIYYYLKKNVEYFRQRGSQMGSMPQISLDVTEKYKIPLPSLKEQEKIVNILNKFDKLCNDTSDGIPAEIEKRQKQYEYYRDKLLSFKEVQVNE